MPIIDVTFEWTIDGPLHVGTGMSRIGGPDRLIRMDGDDPIVPGEAVKGAVRGTAERLARWLIPDLKQQDIPRNLVLRRLFASSGPEDGQYYRYCAARRAFHPGRRTIASTAIEDGVGKQHSLRLVETLHRGARFRGSIGAYADDWTKDSHGQDVLFLCAALLAVQGVGGKKGAGYGSIQCFLISTGNIVNPETLSDPKVIDDLREHLAKGEPK